MSTFCFFVSCLFDCVRLGRSKTLSTDELVSRLIFYCDAVKRMLKGCATSSQFRTPYWDTVFIFKLFNEKKKRIEFTLTKNI